MKRLRSTGLGVKRRQAEPITVEEENQLWEKGLLGDSTPQVLLDTMLYLCGIHFALRSGEEHRSLQLSQFQLLSSPDGLAQLTYTENYSKNNQGGLLHRKIKPKEVTCYANEDNPSRCLVQLFQKYISHRPPDSTSFYLTPLRKLKSDIWYSKMPVGHNTLATTVGRICKKAGILGFKTNHSLRVTSATWLFQCGVDEQLIMSNTGHRSIDGVRSYKRISEEQKKSISTQLQMDNLPTMKILQWTRKGQNFTLAYRHRLLHCPCATKLQHQLLNIASSCPPTFNFASCSAVTINYNLHN